ncbi:heparinase II/III domain-containing protein [Paenibacillus sp. UNC451MF]|uniref:heparinase II/III domain-containing protein n=1 Tax=Paenibacillus sp. UNC451MF TaxID=1449063 RepID=UPI00048CCF16|nr:heparinase II/III family protein [Paenibacillus sp. UNC451MF]
MNAYRLEKLLRNAADPSFQKATDKLRTWAQTAREIDYTITEHEYGNWSHNYYCHQDGTPLKFNWTRPRQHICPVCSKEWNGELFDAAWVTLAHSKLGLGMKHLSVLSFIEDTTEDVNKVKQVLLDYAHWYAGYEVHGDIPYNGPGKLFAQTLDEAHWIIDLCYAYSFVKDKLTKQEKQQIDQGLLIPCAQFLIEHKERQLHNHAVLITSAIGMLGFLLGDERIHQAGLAGPYGLLDQIDRGVLEDGMWYEGNFHYHFYGYHSLLQYCILVEGTSWDLRAHPALKKMFDFPLYYILPDGSLPSMNDASSKMSIPTLAPYYELAYDWYGDTRYRELLRLAYGMESEQASLISEEKAVPLYTAAPAERSSMEALWFGMDLNDVGSYGEQLSSESMTESVSLKQLMAADSSSEISGLTKLVNGKGWHLLVKHSTFGGEHDHMDRLGLSFGAGSEPLFADPGTTAYGVPAHYGWFKHTYSHNTVSLNGKDQPPADGQRLEYCKERWGSWVESAVEWNHEQYRMKDSILLPVEMCPWDDEAYRGSTIRRINVLTDHVLLDIVKVSVPDIRDIDLLYHIHGRMDEVEAWLPFASPVSALDQQWFQNTKYKPFDPAEVLIWQMKTGRLLQAGWCSEPSMLITAATPNNPPNQLRQSLIQRVHGSKERDVVFVHAFAYGANYNEVKASEAAAKFDLQLNVQYGDEGRLRIGLATVAVQYDWSLDWTEGKAKFIESSS